jgi:hypothetical protein
MFILRARCCELHSISSFSRKRKSRISVFIETIEKQLHEIISCLKNDMPQHSLIMRCPISMITFIDFHIRSDMTRKTLPRSSMQIHFLLLRFRPTLLHLQVTYNKYFSSNNLPKISSRFICSGHPARLRNFLCQVTTFTDQPITEIIFLFLSSRGLLSSKVLSTEPPHETTKSNSGLYFLCTNMLSSYIV